MAENYVTAKISEVLPNPHRASIGGGALHPEKITVLVDSMRANGVWDGWPVRRNAEGRLEMVGSTHRLQAARQLYGGKHVLRFQLVNYDDGEMLRGMIDENLAGAESKNLPVREQADYVATARLFLLDHSAACQLKKAHEHGDKDCLLAFLGDSWTVVRLTTLLGLTELAPELGVTSDLKTSNAERLIQFPQAAQREIVKVAGEDIGKRQLRRLLEETKSDRKALSEKTGKVREAAEARLVEKVSKLAKAAHTQKKNPMMGLETVKVTFPKTMSKDEVILAFVSLLNYESLKAAWKLQATALHPDKGGDPVRAANLNELWARIRKLYGKDGIPGA
jgi:hypothetical protein